MSGWSTQEAWRSVFLYSTLTVGPYLVFSKNYIIIGVFILIFLVFLIFIFASVTRHQHTHPPARSRHLPAVFSHMFTRTFSGVFPWWPAGTCSKRLGQSRCGIRPLGTDSGEYNQSSVRVWKQLMWSVHVWLWVCMCTHVFLFWTKRSLLHIWKLAPPLGFIRAQCKSHNPGDFDTVRLKSGAER